MTTTISPNMNLPIPVVSNDPGPDWANNNNACLNAIDSHNHSTGQGVPIAPDGIDISSDLTFDSNNATDVRSVRFHAQASPLALSTDVGCVYESGVDLYYNDGAGNQVRITQGGSVAGSSGTITGLPSGTASASFSAGTFTFQSATLTPATMAVGPLVIGRNAASSKTVTVTPHASQASNYGISLPAALPAATNYMTLDASGNLAFNTGGSTGSGAVVLGTSPTIATPAISSPTMSGTVSGGTYTGATLTSPTINTPTINTATLVSPTISGTATGGTFSGTHTGNGAGITNLDMANAATGTLAVSRGGTGVTTSTGSGNNVLSASPTLNSIDLGGNSTLAGTLDSTAGISISGGYITAQTSGSSSIVQTFGTTVKRNILLSDANKYWIYVEPSAGNISVSMGIVNLAIFSVWVTEHTVTPGSASADFNWYAIKRAP